MEQSDVFQMIQLTLRTILIAAAPVMLVALVVGVTISFLQALTQVQEMTLTFVPKIIAMILTLGFTLAFMFATLESLSTQVFDLITSGAL